MPKFADHVADALLAESNALGARWQAQARAVAPRVAGRPATPWRGVALVNPTLLSAAVAESTPAIVHAIARALRNTPRCQDGVLRAGWAYGAATHRGGATLQDVVKELDLLAAMALYVGERVAEGPQGDGVGAAEGVHVARHLLRAFTILRLAASKGYTHAASEELREHYRILRHDLRNPIGTIRSAVSLMEDESLPAEVRFSARYRAMVVRNATSLDAMIGAGLSDAASEISSLTLQEVSLRDVALAVRRDMREEAESATCTIEVSPSLGVPALQTVLTDAATFELALRSVVSIALSRARPGTPLTISLHGRRQGIAVVAIAYEDSTPPTAAGGEPERSPDETLSFAGSLVGRAGGRVWREDDGTVFLEIQIVEPDLSAESAIAPRVEGGVEREGEGGSASDRPVERDLRPSSTRLPDDLPGGGRRPEQSEGRRPEHGEGRRPERGEGAPPPRRPSPHAGDDLARSSQSDHG